MFKQDNLEMHSPNIVDDNTLKIAEIFPHCVTEARDDNGNLRYVVDFDLLRQELSQSLVEGGQERYRLDWPGKRQAILEANTPIAKTLRPAREESVNFDTTENLFIEGDNLEALKLLQESYLGQVKMIYIDPPYNTGKDFIYEDDFAEDTSDFLQRSEQVDEDGNRLVTNTESNGRFHSDWLTMMYSRLKLARNLLKDDGVIFVSIDDNEYTNLIKLANNIFGERNFVSTLLKKGTGGRQDSTHFAEVHEYIIVYAKNYNSLVVGRESKELSGYDKIEKKTKRLYKTQLLRKWGDNSRRQDRPKLFYPIKAPDGSEVYPMLSANEDGCWRWGKETMMQALEEDRIEFLKNENEEWVPYQKLYKDEANNEKLYTTWIDDIGSESGGKLVKSLFNNKKIFDYPKPLKLLIKLIQMGGVSKNDIVLDFFAGSSTTAHAVMQLNSEDNGSRKFIMAQLPEPIDSVKQQDAYQFCLENDFKPNIAEVSKERIRRAGQKILEDNKDKKGIEDLDIGFRVLKIDSTNMKEVYYTPDEYSQDQLENFESHIKEDRTSEDLLFQVMLDWGVLLSLPIEVKEIKDHLVYYVGFNSLIACFDTLTTELVNEIAKHEPLKFVTSERAISHDQDKTNIKSRFAQLSPNTDVRFI
ncbi:site-specific DNA-methyltransferase [Psychrobacter sanguinis]|uniref:site-specific DNA-methyltransferase n=1 Tax=Psychrobacter sanguinis TaxID=861445 RepID=UPI0028A9F3D4|nr:site-specific DNA-methyltransferase [Psychrobacter sanguinis]